MKSRKECRIHDSGVSSQYPATCKGSGLEISIARAQGSGIRVEGETRSLQLPVSSSQEENSQLSMLHGEGSLLTVGGEKISGGLFLCHLILPAAEGK